MSGEKSTIAEPLPESDKPAGLWKMELGSSTEPMAVPPMPMWLAE